MATVLSGTSGALYYKPAGTKATFTAANVTNGSNKITLPTYLNFQEDDSVVFGTGTGGTLPGGLTAGSEVFIRTYSATTGDTTFASSAGGDELALNSDGTDGTTPFTIDFYEHKSVGDCREWSFEVTREELDTTTIGGTLGQTAPFRTFITGFADGTGSATVYFTDDDSTIASRLIQDVIQRKQVGASFKLYTDLVLDAQGDPVETSSTSIEIPAVINSASYSVNPDDPQAIEIAFRPTAAPTFDFDRS